MHHYFHLQDDIIQSKQTFHHLQTQSRMPIILFHEMRFLFFLFGFHQSLPILNLEDHIPNHDLIQRHYI